MQSISSLCSVMKVHVIFGELLSQKALSSNVLEYDILKSVPKRKRFTVFSLLLGHFNGLMKAFEMMIGLLCVEAKEVYIPKLYDVRVEWSFALQFLTQVAFPKRIYSMSFNTSFEFIYSHFSNFTECPPWRLAFLPAPTSHCQREA